MIGKFPYSGRRSALKSLATLACAGILALLIVSPAVADDALDAARAAGHIGERADAFLGQVAPNAPASAIQLMRDINEKRAAKYAQIAQRNGTSVEAVQAIVAKKIFNQIKPGWYYMDASGNWQRK